MSTYRMTEDELVVLASSGLKKTLAYEQLFADEIELNHLKRIDKVFGKGLQYYVNPSQPLHTDDASVFFRKTGFDTDLNFGSRKVVNQFEELKISLSAIAKLADVAIERKLPIYSVEYNPRQAANEVHDLLYPAFEKKPRDFLKALISAFAAYNILVFEFVETWNKRHKANIDGVFLQPNVIVVKRQQKSLRREIFTLVHELGHYLLNKEEVEKVDFLNSTDKDMSAIEYWCNDFAFAFLSNKYIEIINELDVASASNDYHMDRVAMISEQTHLSRLAIYTHMCLNRQITWHDYQNVKDEFEVEWQRMQKADELQKEKDKLMGIKRGGMPPKPIKSPLLVSTLQSAYYEGVINEYDFCKTLNIRSDKFTSYIE